MRWLWIDSFVQFQSGKSARAVRNLSTAEDFFADHFPGYPLMPGSLMLEGLAQTGGILVGEANNFQEKVVLAKIPWARFQREVVAGNQVVYDVELLHLRPEGASVQGRVSMLNAGQDLTTATAVGEAELFFAHLDRARSQQVFGDRNFVFSGDLMRMLGLTKVLAGRAHECHSGSQMRESGNAGPGC
jgi:3-hydroxyacyl-[acyl-carrier-protein] dehydratase